MATLRTKLDTVTFICMRLAKESSFFVFFLDITTRKRDCKKQQWTVQRGFSRYGFRMSKLQTNCRHTEFVAKKSTSFQLFIKGRTGTVVQTPPIQCGTVVISDENERAHIEIQSMEFRF